MFLRIVKLIAALCLVTLNYSCTLRHNVTDTPYVSDYEEPASNSHLSEAILLGPGQVLPITAQVEMAGETFHLEVAESDQQLALGLMYRPTLPDNRGMLFSFESPIRPSFWMSNVPVPLDIVFIRRGRVKAVMTNVPPCETNHCPTYSPGKVVDQVIELKAGRVHEIGLQIGDLAKVTILR